jgi:putative heme-binding domain-containing protein
MRTLYVALLAAAALSGQHNYTPQDIEDGGRLYRGSCVSCHGPDGNLVAGIDLGQNKFRRASTDDQLVGIIRTGIPGTPMPPGNYTEFQAQTIVAYLRNMAISGRAVSANGDVVRGKAIFEAKGGCSGCHRVRGVGGRTGPDLTDIGMLRRTVELQKALLTPDADMLPGNRHYRVVTKKGETVAGRLMNQDTFSVQLLDAKDQLRYFARSELKESGFVEKSPMPSVQGKLSEQEIADVLSYLSTLKGIEK